MSPDGQAARSAADVLTPQNDREGFQDLLDHPPPTNPVRPPSTEEHITDHPGYPVGWTHGVTITNGWYGFEAPSTTLQVWAGAQTTIEAGATSGTVTNGMIFVVRMPAEGFSGSDADRPGGKLIPLPTSSAVTIKAVDGHVLTVVAEDGASFRFDVDAMKLL